MLRHDHCPKRLPQRCFLCRWYSTSWIKSRYTFCAFAVPVCPTTWILVDKVHGFTPNVQRHNALSASDMSCRNTRRKPSTFQVKLVRFDGDVGHCGCPWLNIAGVPSSRALKHMFPAVDGSAAFRHLLSLHESHRCGSAGDTFIGSVSQG